VLVAGLVSAAVIGPERLLDRAGFSAVEERLVTGIAAGGTPQAPFVYVTSSDPRVPEGLDSELPPIDTNSGVLSVLVRDERGWTRRDLVLGLPRSRHDHATNGLVIDPAGERLYVAQGSMTNMGAPSAGFGRAPEYALSGAILSIDLTKLGNEPYALPTLDDETRPGTDDAGDPFGGNGGRNQAVVVPGGPVQLHATGLRNPYDVALTAKGLLYTIDNGSNWFWGGPPEVELRTCTNRVSEGGRYTPDTLYVVDERSYLGHPNPTRSSTDVTFNVAHAQTPIATPRPRECRHTRAATNALLQFDTSTNGLVEYTASNFGGALEGNLLTASFDRGIYRIRLDESGRSADGSTQLSDVQGYPLDVTAQPDGGPFPGTVWAADWVSGDLVVLEPRDRRSGPHWARLAPTGHARQEVSWVRAGDRFYLAGGDRRHQAYDPRTDTWRDVTPLPERLDHIQGVAVDGRIYYVGGLASFPEPAVGTVSIYDPATDSFSQGTPMPRPRGAGGVAVHEGKIYYAGGLSDGKAVAWLDVYDPSTDRWTQLQDMPRARDHFQAQVVGDRLYAIGGRDSEVGTEMSHNDVYDVSRRSWTTGLAPLPTARGGYASARVGHEIVVLGGESPDKVFSEVEAYDTRRNTWRVLDPMPNPRHGIQAIACDGDVYIAAGGEAPFGDAPSDVASVYVTRPEERCALAPASNVPSADVAFRAVRLGVGLQHPTSLQFGPDGRLYVSEQHGTVNVLAVRRLDSGRYVVDERERIEAIRDIPNHDDVGAPVASWSSFARLVGNRLGVCCSNPGKSPPPVSSAPASRPGDPTRGRALFEQAGCAGCHAFARAGSTAVSGPTLDRAYAFPEAYIQQSIVDPGAVIAPGYPPEQMPPYARTVSRQQLHDLVAFLRQRPTDD
jgi:mono/diheme cytochrome c family protein/glucose/arabinose dehydrogenase